MPAIRSPPSPLRDHLDRGGFGKIVVEVA